MGVFLACMSVYHICAFGSQKGALGPPGLEFQIVVSSHLDVRNRTESSGRAASTLDG